MKLNTPKPFQVSKLWLRTTFFMWLCAFALMGSTTEARAQGPTVYKDWLILGEDHANHIDVFYTVLKCSSTSADQIHLKLFNENPSAKTTGFTVTVTDVATNQSFTSQVSNFQLGVGAIVVADCNANSSLRIDLPAGYNPNNLNVTITF